MIKAILISVAAGGLGTSAIEYLIGYNVIDYLKDKLVAALSAIKRVL